MRRKDYQKKNHNRRYEIRGRDPSSDHEEKFPQKKSKAPTYESNAVNKYEYILISALTSSSPPDSLG